MLKHITLLILLLLCIGNLSAQYGIEDTRMQVIDISNGFDNNQIIPLSRIAHSIRYIPLETKDECLISRITDVFLTDTQIVVLDGNEDKLFRFDLEGNFLGQVGKKGRGPGEYVSINDVEVNLTNETIYIFDLWTRYILKYDLQGKLIGKSSSHPLGNWVAMINDEYFVYFDPSRTIKPGNSFYKMVITDLDGVIVKKYLRQNQSKGEKYKSPCAMQSSVYTHNNSAYFWEVTSDTIIRVSPELSIEPYAFIEQGPRSFPKKKMYDSGYFVNKYNEHSTVFWLMETGNFYFLRGITNYRLAALIYDKATKECVNFSNERKYLHNDLDNGPGFWPTGKINDSTLFSSITPIDAMELIAEMQKVNQVFSSELLAIVNKSKFIDNPILILVELHGKENN